MDYKTVPREVFVVYMAIKECGGDVRKSNIALLEIELKVGRVCEYAIPADIAL